MLKLCKHCQSGDICVEWGVMMGKGEAELPSAWLSLRKLYIALVSLVFQAEGMAMRKS